MGTNKNRTRRPFKGLLFALVLIGAGKVILLANLGFFSTEYVNILFSWPMVFVLFGLIALAKLNLTASALFFSVGGFFLIGKIGEIPNNFLGSIPPDFTHTYWPVLLIIAGVVLGLKSLFSKNKCCGTKDKKEVFEKFKEHREFKTGNNSFNKNTAFGSAEHIVLDPEFKGGEINTAFGETILDLRKTQLTEEITNLEVKLIFGSVVIYVPANWNVQLNVNSMFGAFEDKRKFISETPDTTKTLVILGSVLFGGGELKN